MAMPARAVDLLLRCLEERAAVDNTRQVVGAREFAFVVVRAAERGDEVGDEEKRGESREHVEIGDEGARVEVACVLFGEKITGCAGERDEDGGASPDEPSDERDGQEIENVERDVRPGQVVDNALQDDEEEAENTQK
jgi:hypothetical protein